MKFILGMLLGILLLPVGTYLYFASGKAPVATTDSDMPFEEFLAHKALDKRLERDMPKSVPIQASEAHYVAGADHEAIEWSRAQASGDKYAADNSTAGRIRRRTGVPFGGSRLIGSYATIARLLDEMAEIEGLAGVMLTFDDFVIGVEQFGQRIQPLMRSRAKLAVAA